MIKNIDCRGLECPKPVLETKKALEQKDFETLTIQVDNLTAKENVTRFLKSNNIEPEVQETDYGYLISTGEIEIKEETQQENTLKGNTYMIKSKYLGVGGEELGAILMNGFLYTLTQVEPLPQKILLLNSAVELSTINEETIRHLKALEEKGTEIYSCGTCLNFYELTEKLQVGKIGNMYDVVESLQGQAKVITI